MTGVGGWVQVTCKGLKQTFPTNNNILKASTLSRQRSLHFLKKLKELITAKFSQNVFRFLLKKYFSLNNSEYFGIKLAEIFSC